MGTSRSRDIRFIRNLLLLAATVLILIFASGIIMPIVFSGFIAAFLSPMVNRLQRVKIPKGISIFLVVFITSLFVFGLLFVLSYESQKIIASMPSSNIEKVMDESTKTVELAVNQSIPKYKSVVDSTLEKAKEYGAFLIPDLLSRASDTLIFFITCPIYVFFFLMYKSNIRGFYFESLDKKNRKEGNEIIEEIERAFSSYLKGMVIVITIIATLTSLGLWFLGIDYPVFLGVLAGLLSLIPYVGIIVSALIPVVMAILMKDSLWYVGGVIAVFSIVQFLEGNFITPKIVGNKVDINPLVVIIGLVIFGAVAGITAMIITIPFLALIKITSSKLPTWTPIHKLLEA